MMLSSNKNRVNKTNKVSDVRSISVGLSKKNNIRNKRMRLEGETLGFSSRGQVSLEIMIYFIIITLLLTIISYSAMSRSNSILDEKVNMEARRVANLVAIEIDTAVSVGEGYEHIFQLPQHLYGETDYTVTISAEYQRLYVDWDDRSYTLPLVTGNITGTVSKGINTIKNEQGVIRLG